MPVLIVPADLSPCQIEFPDDCKRTKRGRHAASSSLHLRPATAVEVTDDELAHICKAHPALARSLIVHVPRRPPRSGAKSAGRPKEVKPAEQPARRRRRGEGG